MLRVEQVTRRFGATVAVDDVSLAIERAEILGLVGENGAGKTTLMRIVAGELEPDRGQVRVDGNVGMVHQHFALVPEFSIAENLALARPGFAFTSRRAMNDDAERTIEASGIALRDVSRRAAELSVGEKSKLELIKAISGQPSLLILDEPTSVLTPFESEELFAVMQRLASAGTAIVFISHKVREVVGVAPRIVVMRNGRVVSDGVGMSEEQIATAMVGRPLIRPSATFSRKREKALIETPLPVHRGEIVAVVGVAGNGQAELLSVIPSRADGEESGRGARFPHPDSSHSAALGMTVAFIPEDRTRDGIVAQMTIAENLALRGVRDAKTVIDTYGIRARGPNQLAGELSGGNQQKLVLARELERKPELIVAAEPTRGLDIEATRLIHEQLREAVAAGAGVLLVTSDLDEAFALADTIHVIYRGRLSEPMTPATASGRVAQLMAGLE